MAPSHVDNAAACTCVDDAQSRVVPAPPREPTSKVLISHGDPARGGLRGSHPDSEPETASEQSDEDGTVTQQAAHADSDGRHACLHRTRASLRGPPNGGRAHGVP